MNSIFWPAPNVWVFIAQLVEHYSTNTEATDSNPVEALKIFFLFLFFFAVAEIAISTAVVTSSFQMLSVA